MAQLTDTTHTFTHAKSSPFAPVHVMEYALSAANGTGIAEKREEIQNYNHWGTSCNIGGNARDAPNTWCLCRCARSGREPQDGADTKEPLSLIKH